MSATETQVNVNTNLQKQDLKNLDVTNLTALSPEVISRQATINIGTIGHVAHGKSTVVKAISGVQTVRFKNELERNITIKLERISRNRILELLKSPSLLREHEKREEEKVLRLAREREMFLQMDRLETYKVPKIPITPSLSCTSLLIAEGRRCTSLTPSSGYESLYENASSCGSECSTPTTKTLLGKKLPWSLKRLQQEQFKQATKRRWSDCTGGKTSKAKRRKGSPPEYIVEHIVSLESINGKPVFLVKWLNYPETQNTWESLNNVIECKALEEFIDYQMQYFEEAIAVITREIEAQIESESLRLSVDDVNVLDLDKYEPLALKTELLLLAQFREAGSRSQREPEKIRKRAIELMLRKPFYYMRQQQLRDLQVWEERMNEIEGEAPIKIENNVDLEVLDREFRYIKESFASAGVVISDNVLIGCKCDQECTRTGNCCAKMADGIFAYDKRGYLRIRPGEAIYECNKNCNCDETCRNRVIQHGRKNSLCLFKTPTGCGWGVRALQAIRKGEFVCEYVGEIVTVEEANERGKIYDAIGRTYLFDLDYNTTAESVYTIDAAMYGNISHFINHSCDPNLSVFPFWINNLDINMPRLAFFALRNIPVGEELSFDYIRGNTDVQEHEYQNLSEAEKVSCRCGAENCRKVLF